MQKSNVRYGVVNVKERMEYEKMFHIPYGYELTTFDERDAINYAKKQKNANVIVERIFDTSVAVNNKEEVFRSGDFKEGGNA